MNEKMIQHIINHVNNLKYDNDIDIFHHSLFEGHKIEKKTFKRKSWFN